MSIQDVRHRFRRSSIRTDKIEFDIGNWSIVGSDLARLDVALRAIELQPSYCDEPVQLFGTPSTRQDGLLRYLPFAERASSPQVGAFDRRANFNPPLPLFAGRLKFSAHPERYATDEQGQWLTARVTMSPLRIFRHQEPQTQEPVVFGRATPLPDDGEYSLDGQDNYAPRDVWLNSERELDWIPEVAGYISAISDNLSEVICRVGRSRRAAARYSDLTQNVAFRSRHYIQLREVESVLEIFDDDPTLLVRRLEPVLASLGGTLFANEYPITGGPAVEDALRGNSRSLLVQISNTKKLRVYAKTNRRVRFEVVHKIDSSQSRDLLGGGVTYESEEGRDLQVQLEDWLERIRNDAGRYLALVMDRLVQRPMQEARLGTPLYSFLSRLNELAGNEEDAEQLLSLVINNYRLDAATLPRHLRDALNRQQRHVRPLFVRRMPRGPFVLVPEYEGCVEWLRAEAHRL